MRGGEDEEGKEHRRREREGWRVSKDKRDREEDEK